MSPTSRARARCTCARSPIPPIAGGRSPPAAARSRSGRTPGESCSTARPAAAADSQMVMQVTTGPSFVPGARQGALSAHPVLEQRDPSAVCGHAGRPSLRDDSQHRDRPDGPTRRGGELLRGIEGEGGSSVSAARATVSPPRSPTATGSSGSWARAAWPRSIWPTTSGTTATSRSRCSSRSWPRHRGRAVPRRDQDHRQAAASAHPAAARLGRGGRPRSST